MAIGEILPKRRASLDKKDSKILSMLMHDARVSVSEISKKVELTKSNISRRISRLEGIGLIGGYHAFIDVSKVGIKTTIALLKLRPEDRKVHLDTLVSRDEIYAVSETSGYFDAVIGIYSQDEDDRDVLLDVIVDERRVKDFFVSDAKTIFPKLSYSGNVLSNEKRQPPVRKSEAIDKKDRKILFELSRDCRAPAVRIARRLKLPRATMIYRIKRMVGSGIIRKFQPNVNFFMLGVEFYMLRFILSKPSMTGKMIAFLSATGRANTILRMDCCCQVLAFMYFKDNAEFRAFEDQVQSRFKDCMKSHEFSTAKAQYKLDWFPKSFI